MTITIKTSDNDSAFEISTKPSYKSKIKIKRKNSSGEFKEIIQRDTELEEMSIDKANPNQDKEMVVIHSRKRTGKTNVCCIFNINSDIFPFANIFMFCFSIFLIIYAGDGFFNFQCFYGRDHRTTLQTYLSQIYNYEISDLVSMIVVYVNSSILVLIGVMLLFSLLLKVLRWIGFLRGTGYFSKQHVVQKVAESFATLAILVYGTAFSCMLGVFGNFETRSYIDLLIHIVVLSVFYMKATKWVTVLMLPLFWFQHHLITLFEVVPYIGYSRREYYTELFSQICFKSGLADTAYYALKSFEGVCALTFLIGIGFLIFGLCIGVMARIGSEIVLLALKFTFVKYIILMCAGIVFDKYSITVIAQQYVLMAFIGGLIYTSYPETNFSWFFTHRLRRDIHTQKIVSDA